MLGRAQPDIEPSTAVGCLCRAAVAGEEEPAAGDAGSVELEAALAGGEIGAADHHLEPQICARQEVFGDRLGVDHAALVGEWADVQAQADDSAGDEGLVTIQHVFHGLVQQGSVGIAPGWLGEHGVPRADSGLLGLEPQQCIGARRLHVGRWRATAVDRPVAVRRKEDGFLDQGDEGRSFCIIAARQARSEHTQHAFQPGAGHCPGQLRAKECICFPHVDVQPGQGGDVGLECIPQALREFHDLIPGGEALAAGIGCHCVGKEGRDERAGRVGVEVGQHARLCPWQV